jgi:L-amino acid N-acyltransferase YncA
MEHVEPVKLRLLTLKDLNAIADIDESILGTRRVNYWEARLERAETSGVPSLAAEVNGKIAGFIFGSSSSWEYGMPENVAWIDTIGIRNEHKKKGIARLLFREMFSMFKKIGVDTVYVFVHQNDGDLLQFFDRMGFKRGDMINLEMNI